MTKNDQTLRPIYDESWRNGVRIEVYFHEQIVEGYDDSDRIELVVTTEDGDRPSLMMNVEDAIGVIRGLAGGIQRVIDVGVSVCPKQE